MSNQPEVNSNTLSREISHCEVVASRGTFARAMCSHLLHRLPFALTQRVTVPIQCVGQHECARAHPKVGLIAISLVEILQLCRRESL